MLLKFDDRLKKAEFSRHERRRIKRTILRDIKMAVDTFFKGET